MWITCTHMLILWWTQRKQAEAAWSSGWFSVSIPAHTLARIRCPLDTSCSNAASHEGEACCAKGKWKYWGANSKLRSCSLSNWAWTAIAGTHRCDWSGEVWSPDWCTGTQYMAQPLFLCHWTPLGQKFHSWEGGDTHLEAIEPIWTYISGLML